MRFLSAVLVFAVASPLIADDPADDQRYKTIKELFAAYKETTEDRDWKSLFLLGTPERQNTDILMIAVSAATSDDAALRSLLDKHGVNWKQFDHKWTEADQQRLMREYPVVAASLGKQATNKAQLFVAAQTHIYKKGSPWSTKVHELANVVRSGGTAVGESIEERTCIERHYDAEGKPLVQIPRKVSSKSRLWFRQIDGHWYLSTETEVARVNGNSAPAQ